VAYIKQDKYNKRLVFAIAKRTSFPEDTVRDIINCLMDIICEELRVNGEIYVSGLGRFWRKEGTKNCAFVQKLIKFYMVKFTPSIRTKDIVNNRFNNVGGSGTLYLTEKEKKERRRKTKQNRKANSKKNEYEIRMSAKLEEVTIKEEKRNVRKEILSNYGLRDELSEDENNE